MQLLARAPTRHYFVSIFIITAALFLTFSAVIYKHYDEARKLNEWTLYNYEVIRITRRVLQDLVDMETGVRGFQITGKQNFLEPYEASKTSIVVELQKLWEYTADDPTTRGNIDIWQKRIKSFIDTLSAQVDLITKSGRDSTTAEAADAQKLQMDSLRALLEGYINARREDLKHQLEVAHDKQENFKYILSIGTFMAIGGMLVATMVILALLRRSHTAENEARSVENRLLAVMSGLNDGLFDYNVIDQTIYFSPAFKSMLGYTETELPDTIDMFLSLVHPDDVRETWAAKPYEEIDTIYSHAFRVRHKHGHWIWVLSRGVGVKDNGGNIIRLIGAHTDITEQKSREEELKQLNNEMETFTYITSHDLRAPLVNLRGFASEMSRALARVLPIMKKVEASLDAEDRKKMKESIEEDIPESLKFIDQSVEKMDKLTTAVLDLSRIGKREYKVEQVNTQTIVQRCIDVLAYEISQKDITVTCGDLPTVYSDALALEQVFSNILDNAVKYLDAARKGKIDISANESGNDVVFSIQDNGRGIAEQDHEKVFQIFRRARNTLDVRGQGMGMTYVQATLRKLGGTIWFDSVQGQGTTFYFHLPKYNRMKGI